jgi:hypothetical protein
MQHDRFSHPAGSHGNSSTGAHRFFEIPYCSRPTSFQSAMRVQQAITPWQGRIFSSPHDSMLSPAFFLLL